jgi:zinc protease
MILSLHLTARTATAFLFLFLLMVAAFPAHARASDLKIEEFTLSNGMRFVLLPNEQSTAVMWTLWYNAGAADEVPGKTGLAHFLEHLMFKGTKTRASGDYDQLVKTNGAEANAFTTREYTMYYVRMQKVLLPQIMEFEADRMRNLVFDGKLIETERGVIKEERRQRIENDPAMLFLEERDALLFPDHPYGRPDIGSMEEVEKHSARDFADFYDRFYHPNNAMAVVSGNLSLAEFRGLAQKYFGAVPPSPNLPERKVQPLPAKAVQQSIERVSASVRWPFLARQYAVPSYSTAEDKDALALEFLADLLGGGVQGLLVKELVYDQHLASNVSVYYDGGGRHGGTFTITVAMNTAAGKKPDVAGIESRIDKVLGAVMNEGPAAGKLANFLQRGRVSRAYILDQQSGMAMWVGDALMRGWNMPDYYSLRPWESLTPDDVRRSMARNILIERSVTSILFRDAGATP